MSVLDTAWQAKVGVTVGGGSEVLLTNNSWTLNDDTVVAEGHNAVDGTKRVKGRPDYSGSVEGFYDGDNPIGDVLVGGDSAVLKLYLSGSQSTKFYSIPAIVSNVSTEAAGDDIVAISFDFALESGVLTYPV